jgi:hypothetical protein
LGIDQGKALGADDSGSGGLRQQSRHGFSARLVMVYGFIPLPGREEKIALYNKLAILYYGLRTGKIK